jgi:hypothetical protein
MDTNTDTLQRRWMGQQDEVGRSTHSLRYIRQMLEWGFDKEFIARDMGINLASLEVRLNRAKKREQDGNQRIEPKIGSSQSDSGSSQEAEG